MNSRTKPYFFAFDTQSKPGKMIAHSVRIETIELEAGETLDTTKFTVFPADFDEDKRLRQLCRSAHSFIVQNKINPETL